jgi:hypothetical protein
LVIPAGIVKSTDPDNALPTTISFVGLTVKRGLTPLKKDQGAPFTKSGWAILIPGPLAIPKLTDLGPAVIR